MDGIIEDIARGFLRGIGYIIAEIFFGTICYWVGWPVCKILTLGKFPASNDVVYLDSGWGPRKNNFWCSAVGLLIIILVGLYFMGQFS